MLAELAVHTLADPLFFESAARWDPVSSRLPVSRQGPPTGWQRVVEDVWEEWRPPGVALPAQGWKVHVAATPDTAADTVAAVARYCTGAGRTLKFLWSRRVVEALTGKYAPRSAAGKVVTVYPTDEDELARDLEALDALVGGRAGPHVLTDLRWADGPVSVRWGGFRSRWCSDADDRRVLAVERPDGRLVPDDRRPSFRVPDWVDVPEVLAPALAARGGGADLGVTVTEALHFSAGGGVYRGRRGEEPVVLKEARPHVGLDGRGRDAVDRLDDEARALRRLDGVPGVPRLHEVRQVWEHRFLVLEDLGGRTLQAWVAEHHPLVNHRDTPDGLAAYHRRAEEVHARVLDLVARLHARGVVFGDLHPANVLVTADPARPAPDVALVDFELAFDVTARDHRPTLGYAGFVPRTRYGTEVDHHAAAVLRLWLHLPLAGLLALAPGKLRELAGEADRLFGLDGLLRGHVEDRLPVDDEIAAGPARTGVAGPAASPAARRADLVRGIEVTATPERPDRLLPGDASALPDGGDGFAHGAAGVLWLLDRLGGPPRPAWEGWLRASAGRTPREAGLLVGAHGAVHTLGALGYLEEALDLAHRSRRLVDDLEEVGLADGMAGVGLSSLALWRATGDREYRDRALHLAVRLRAALDDGRPHGVDRDPRTTGARDAGTRAGLWWGWSGVALFLLRLHEQGGDPRWRAGAVDALRRDLGLCVEVGDGSLQVDGGFRLLPYVDVGSAGIALVAEQLLHHDLGDDDRGGAIRRAVPGLARALRSPFVADAGLAAGRAGLLATAHRLAASAVVGADCVDAAAAVAEHRAHTDWHLLRLDDGVAVPGRGGVRLASDLATGTAGVLAALGVADGVLTAPLPFLDPAPAPTGHPDSVSRPVGAAPSTTRGR